MIIVKRRRTKIRFGSFRRNLWNKNENFKNRLSSYNIAHHNIKKLVLLRLCCNVYKYFCMLNYHNYLIIYKNVFNFILK